MELFSILGSDFESNISQSMKLNYLSREHLKEMFKKEMNTIDLSVQIEETTNTKDIINKGRILCWIMTSPNTHWEVTVVIRLVS